MHFMLAVVFQLLIPFVVEISQALPIARGFFVSESEQITSTATLRVKTPGGQVLPASFRVLSRWRGLPSDTTKPIKVVLVDFTPSGSGTYTIDNSDAALPSFVPIAVTESGAAFTVNTGAMTAQVPKMGANLATSLVVGAAEQLGATKPQILVTLPARSRLVQLAGQSGVVAAPAGSNRIRVNLPGAWAVGQRLRFAWEARFVRYGEGIPKALVYEGNYGYNGNFQAYGGRRFIFDEGNRNIILTQYNSIFDGGIKYFDRKEPRGSDNIPDGLEGVTVKDYDAFLEPVATITAIQGDELVLDRALTRAQMVNCEVLPVGDVASPVAKFEADSATVVEQNSHRLVIKQAGTFRLSGSNPYPHLVVNVWWEFYAGQPYARVRMDLLNRTGNINERPQEAVWSSVRVSVNTAASATTYNDQVLVNAGTSDSASARVLAGQTVSTATAGLLGLSVPEFPEHYPQRLSGLNNQIDYWPFPVVGTPHVFPRDRRAVWEFYLGQNASAGASNVGRALAIQDATYTARSKAVRYEMLPKRTWTAGDFAPGTTAEQVDAANRLERMIGCSYDISQCDSQASLGSQIRMDSFAWRVSDHTQTGNNQRGRHFGWDAFGQFQDAGDGFTHNRYDEPFIHLFEYLRSGDGRAFRLGAEGARYMSTLGMCWSAFARNGNTAANLEGLSWYEKGSDPFNQIIEPKATHSWDEGVWLYWALTGDPIVYESAIKRRDAARRWNYNGVGYGAGTIGSGLDYNEARGPGWAALNAGAAHRWGGDAIDAQREAQYLGNLADSEIAQGVHGVYVARIEDRNYAALSSTGTQPFIWAGYPSVALREYIMRKRYEREPDAKMEGFARRVAMWVVNGDATSATPTEYRPLRAGVFEGEAYRPLGGVYSWYPGKVTRDTETENANAVMLLNSVSLGAWLADSGPLRATAGMLARDLAYYRDFPAGALHPATRSPITLRNTQYNGSARKLTFQTAQGTYGWLWDALGSQVVTPNQQPVIASLNTLSPSTVVQGSSDIVLIVSGLNFLNSTVVKWGQTALATQYSSPIQVFATVPAALLTQVGAFNVTAVNPDGASVSKVFKVTSPASNRPRMAYVWVTRNSAGAMAVIASGDNFGAGAQIFVNGYPLSNTSLAGFVLSAPLPEAYAGYQITVQVRASDGTFSNQAKVTAPSAGLLNRPVRRVGR